MSRSLRETGIAAALIVAAIVSLIAAVSTAAKGGNDTSRSEANSAASELPPGSPDLIHPEELARIMQSSGAAKPTVLNVGPRVIYLQAHIPGAVFIGPTASPEGLQKLQSRAASLPRDSSIVIYCGCCPWEHCPNVGPAFKELKQMGFKKLKVLYIANTFGSDWVEKGYPTAKGE